MASSSELTSVADEPESTPPRSDALKRYDAFVDRIVEACASPADQQALRRALARPVNEVPARTHKVLLAKGWIPDSHKPRPYYAVAALIAARPRSQRNTGATTAPSPSPPHDASSEPADAAPPTVSRFRPYGTVLGESLARAVFRESEALKENPTESRLHLMVRQDIDGIHRMLPAVVRLVSGTGVRVDYACLLKDLRAWPEHRDDVTTRWLESYYRTLRVEREKRRKAAMADNPPTSDQ